MTADSANIILRLLPIPKSFPVFLSAMKIYSPFRKKQPIANSKKHDISSRLCRVDKNKMLNHPVPISPRFPGMATFFSSMRFFHGLPEKGKCLTATPIPEKKSGADAIKKS